MRYVRSMSTDYTVLQTKGLTVELCEGSNLFAINIETDDAPGGSRLMTGGERFPSGVSTTRALTADDVVTMAIEMLKVASYSMDAADMQRAAVRIENAAPELMHAIRQAPGAT